MLALPLLLASLASAQTTATDTPAADAGVPVSGFDAHGFRLVSFDADPRDPLRYQRPGRMEAGSWYAGALGEYASRPLVFQPADTLDVVLSDVVAANFAAGVVATEQVRFDLSLPLYLASTGPSGAQGAGLGDVRVSSLVTAIAPDDTGGLGLGVVAALDVPTGDPEAYLGDTGVAGLLAAAFTYEADLLTLSGRAGARIAPNSDPDVRPAPTEGGDSLELAGGVGYLLDAHTGFTVETDLSLPVSPTVREAIGVSAQATLGVRHVRPSGGHVSGGVGVGLGAGAGSSPLRLLLGGGFGSAAATVRDTDGDGLADSTDACVNEAETANGFRDDDGCPDVLPVLTLSATVDGAPVDAAYQVTVGEETLTGEGPTLQVSGLPGTEVSLVASSGACLRAERSLTLGEIDAEVATALEPVRATVNVRVVNADGDLLEGAEVRYLVDDELCLPAERGVPGGEASHQVGPGAYEVYVTAQGYDMYQGSFELAEGDEHALEVTLQPQE
jgi:hypothetical protein